eukprot:gene23542-29766_t
MFLVELLGFSPHNLKAFDSTTSKLWVPSPHKTISQGSSTTLLCALDPNITRGGYYSDCQIETVEVHERASDQQLMSKLWE